MINPKTLYTIRDIKTNEILVASPFLQHILDLDLKPNEIKDGSILTMENSGEKYRIERVTHFPFKSEQLYLNKFPYNFTTLIEVSEFVLAENIDAVEC